MLGKPILRGKAAESVGGFDLVLWNHDNDNEYTLMCYPIAICYTNSDFGPHIGEAFCLPLNVGEKGKDVFYMLEDGDVTLPELHKYFHEPVKHAHAIGMKVREIR